MVGWSIHQFAVPPSISTERRHPALDRVGRRCYDNSLTETLNRLYKSECVRPTVLHDRADTDGPVDAVLGEPGWVHEPQWDSFRAW